MEEIYKEITLILDILKSIEEFNEWLNQRRERKQIQSRQCLGAVLHLPQSPLLTEFIYLSGWGASKEDSWERS